MICDNIEFLHSIEIDVIVKGAKGDGGSLYLSLGIPLFLWHCWLNVLAYDVVLLCVCGSFWAKKLDSWIVFLELSTISFMSFLG